MSDTISALSDKPLLSYKSEDSMSAIEPSAQNIKRERKSMADIDRPIMTSRLSTKENLKRLLSLRRKEAKIKVQPSMIYPVDDPNPPTISLWDAAKSGDLAALKWHLASATNFTALVNSRDPDADFTLLHAVVSHCQNPTEPMRVLLDYGADANARNMYNVQAIHIVSLTSPAPLDPLRLLIQYGADVNARDGDGWTPLHYTARFCPSPLSPLRMLVDHGAAIDTSDAAGKTPLFCLLANRDDRETVEWMVAVGADPRAEADFLDRRTGVTTRGNTLVQAVKYRRIESLRALIERAPECITPAAVEQALGLVHRMALQAKMEAGRAPLSPVSPVSPGPKSLGLVAEVEKENVIENLEEMDKMLRGAREALKGMEKKRARDEAQRRPSVLKRISNKLSKQASKAFSETA